MKELFMMQSIQPTRRDLARLLAVAAIPGLPLALAREASAASDQADLVTRANTTISAARGDPQFGNAPDLFKKARALMVIPELVKGGFFVGGEGGNAVLLTRTAGGTWGNPLFYTLGAVSFGLQIGLEQAEVILFVMSQKALRAWTEDQVTLGAKAGLTVLVVGSNTSANTTTNADVDVLAWAKSKGAYAGLTLEGSAIKPRHEWNTAYYGHAVSPASVLKL
jgi:lipid-binding SYLF domain-containing protein